MTSVESFTCDLYPLTNYKITEKAKQPSKYSSFGDKMKHLKTVYTKQIENENSYDLRIVVEGVLLIHMHNHPHVLLLQTEDNSFKLPGGRLRPNEDILQGLNRKLNRRLAPENIEYEWEIAELISVWYRPDFNEYMYPYLPAHITCPKERRDIYLIPLPEHLQFSIASNFKLLAVPLFELYDNTHRYGPILSSFPQLLARINFVCREFIADEQMTDETKVNVIDDGMNDVDKDDDEQSRFEVEENIGMDDINFTQIGNEDEMNDLYNNIPTTTISTKIDIYRTESAESNDMNFEFF